MKLIKSMDFESAIKTLLKNKDGVVYQKVATFNDGVELYLVVGWQDGYEETNDLYQDKGGSRCYTICANLAINQSALQCDYNLDWEMLEYENGEVYDAEQPLAKNEDFDKLARYFTKNVEDIVKLYNRGELRW